jgi:hypothetical protein
LSGNTFAVSGSGEFYDNGGDIFFNRMEYRFERFLPCNYISGGYRACRDDFSYYIDGELWERWKDDDDYPFHESAIYAGIPPRFEITAMYYIDHLVTRGVGFPEPHGAPTFYGAPVKEEFDTFEIPLPKIEPIIDTNSLFTLGADQVSLQYIEPRYGYNLSDYDAYLIRQQLINETGSDLLEDYADEAAQIKALIEAGVSFRKEIGLEYGKSLTANQINLLKKDIVWMVETEIDGQKVLAPAVYLAKSTKNSITKDRAGK